MSNKITFKELIDLISERSQKSKSFTDGFLRELVGIIESGLKENGSVTIAGFGKFELRWINDRKGINPQTGEDITIPGHNKVVFKPYKSLREHVNKPYLYMDSHVLDDDSDGDPGLLESEDIKSNQPLSSVQEDPFGPDVDDDIEKLVFERPSPVRDRKAAKRIHVTSLSQKRDPDWVSRVHQESSFRWSYAAATLLVTIIILTALYFLPFEEQSTNQALPESAQSELPASASQQLPESTEPEIPESSTRPPTEPDYNVVPETPPRPDVIDDQLQTVSNTPEAENTLMSVEQGQTLWTIAEENLIDPYLWPWIYHLNGNNITDPNILLPGNQVTIPVISNPNELSEENLMEIASGYLDVYMWYRNRDPENARYFLWAAGSYHEGILDQAEGSVNENDLAFARNR